MKASLSGRRVEEAGDDLERLGRGDVVLGDDDLLVVTGPLVRTHCTPFR